MIVVATIRVARRFIPTRWWTRPPYLPVPPWDYVSFRLHTAYGRVRLPPRRDLVRYIRWADRMQRRHP